MRHCILYACMSASGLENNTVAAGHYNADIAEMTTASVCKYILKLPFVSGVAYCRD